MAQPTDGSKALSEVDAAYVAGLLDGKAHLSVRRRNGRRASEVALRVGADDRVFLEHLQAVTGLGRVERAGSSAAYRWSVDGQRAIAKLLSVVGPHMRRRLNEWSAALADQPGAASATSCLVCGEPPLARGLCDMHYYAARRRDLLGPVVRGGCAVCGSLGGPGDLGVEHSDLPELSRPTSPGFVLCSTCHAALEAVRRRKRAGEDGAAPAAGSSHYVGA